MLVVCCLLRFSLNFEIPIISDSILEVVNPFSRKETEIFVIPIFP